MLVTQPFIQAFCDLCLHTLDLETTNRSRYLKDRNRFQNANTRTRQRNQKAKSRPAGQGTGNAAPTGADQHRTNRGFHQDMQPTARIEGQCSMPFPML